jgi:hypothetical protein
VKVKKLDSFIYTELEPRIGEYWYLWKCAYDEVLFNQKTKPEIWIDENSNKFLILSYIKTEDQGVIPNILLDCFVPMWYINKFFEDEDFINACGYKIINNHRGDYCIPLHEFSNFDNYKNKLSSSVQKTWNKCEKNIKVERVSIKDFTKWYILLSHNKCLRWKDTLDFRVNCIETDFIAGKIFNEHCFLYTIHNEPIAFSWFNTFESEINWVNTYYELSYRQKYAIGNYSLLKNIQMLFEYSYFNMGIHIYDYKCNYLPFYKKIKGIRKL